LGQARLCEHEAFRNLIEATKVAESACRQLAFMRSDQRWMLYANVYGNAAKVASDLMNGAPQPLEHKFLQ
jgi:hypothetical protein